MDDKDLYNEENPFDAATWAELPSLLENLSEPVHLIVWGDEMAGVRDKQAAILCRTLANRFGQIQYQMLPRRINYDYWPVIGVMGGTQEDWQDFGVRIIGLPDGYQMTSFITAVQAVAFRGSTLEALTRIQLAKLKEDVRLEVFVAADNEAGAMMTHPLFNMAVVSPHVRTFMVMADQFTTAVARYSINYLPHTVINGRVHIEGVVSEETILRHMARAIND